MWDESSKLYTLAGGKPNKTMYAWDWPQHNTRIRFAHMQYEQNMYNWQGSQIAYLAYDELTHFSETAFFYMLSRNRSMCGVKPRVRATVNPDPDSWVKDFLAPWVDAEWQRAHGWQAEPGRVLRFYRDGDTTQWLRPGEPLPVGIGRDRIKTATYIPAQLSDNPALLRANPDYYANLMALPMIERERLLGGPLAWSLRLEGDLFKQQWFQIVDAAPVTFTQAVRRWDLASTQPRPGYSDPDWTCGVKMARTPEGIYYILDVIFARETPAGVKALVQQTAALDGYGVAIRLPQDPGQAGKAQLHDLVSALDGYDVGGEPETGDKATRAKPFSAQAEVGNVKLVHGHWNAQYLNQLTAFPNARVHDDAVDASSGAHWYLSKPDDDTTPAAGPPIILAGRRQG